MMCSEIIATFVGMTRNTQTKCVRNVCVSIKPCGTHTNHRP